jgi:hypothetical protein
MVINLNDYRKAKTAKHVEYRCYEEERMCVNWNPAVSLIAMSCYQTPQELSPQLPEDFTAEDILGFKDRVYALATQI